MALCLRNWYVVPASGPDCASLEGVRSDGTLDSIPCSSISRLSSRVLMRDDGVQICLEGELHKDSAALSGVTRAMQLAFAAGFPDNYLNYLNSLKGVSAGDKVRITDGKNAGSEGVVCVVKDKGWFGIDLGSDIVNARAKQFELVAAGAEKREKRKRQCDTPGCDFEFGHLGIHSTERVRLTRPSASTALVPAAAHALVGLQADPAAASQQLARLAGPSPGPAPGLPADAAQEAAAPEPPASMPSMALAAAPPTALAVRPVDRASTIAALTAALPSTSAEALSAAAAYLNEEEARALVASQKAKDVAREALSESTRLVHETIGKASAALVPPPGPEVLTLSPAVERREGSSYLARPNQVNAAAMSWVNRCIASTEELKTARDLYVKDKDEAEIATQRFKDTLRDIRVGCGSASASALSSVKEIKQAINSMQQELTTLTISPAIQRKRDDLISELEAELGSKERELRAIEDMERGINSTLNAL